ncbi:MAG: hypothetical protein WC027_02300 [Candidatus Paceibacterota bacterium]
MQIKQYFNINKDEIDFRKRNIFIPICLGNKFFSEKGVLKKNISDYLDWALANTKDKVLFVVVDRIQDTNFFVRNNSKTEKASTVHVLKEGEGLKIELEKLVAQLSKEKQSLIHIVRWEDYQNSDPHWAHITHTIYKEFKNNKEFRESVLNCVKTSVTDRKFDEDEYLRLCDYVLDEFCLAYSGINYEGNHFGLYIYPVTDSVLELIEDIKAGKIFPKIEEKLPKVKTGVLILN